MSNSISQKLRKTRLQKKISIDDVFVKTKISKFIIRKFELLDDNQIFLMPQSHLLKTYANFLNIQINNRVNKSHINKDMKNVKSSNNLLATNFFHLLNFVTFKFYAPLFVIGIIIFLNINFKENKSLYSKIINDSELDVSSDTINQLSENKTSYAIQDTLNMLNEKTSKTFKNINLETKENKIDINSNFSKLTLFFNGEVWVEISNLNEVIVRKVFNKGEELSLDLVKEDEIFVTSGNLGLISMKHSQQEIKSLGIKGEIGRKQIF